VIQGNAIFIAYEKKDFNLIHTIAKRSQDRKQNKYKVIIVLNWNRKNITDIAYLRKE
jgi:hypothetical protein